MVLSASSPPCGMLKGLWQKVRLPSSSYSYIGKSTIQQKRNASFSMRSSPTPSSVRRKPACFAASFSSAMRATNAPGASASRSASASLHSAANLAMPPERPPLSSVLNQYIFSAPFDLHFSATPSMNLRVGDAPLTATALIVLPAVKKGALPVRMSVTSLMTSGLRRSGLSVP